MEIFSSKCNKKIFSYLFFAPHLIYVCLGEWYASKIHYHHKRQFESQKECEKYFGAIHSNRHCTVAYISIYELSKMTHCYPKQINGMHW